MIATIVIVVWFWLLYAMLARVVGGFLFRYEKQSYETVWWLGWLWPLVICYYGWRRFDEWVDMDKARRAAERRAK